MAVRVISKRDGRTKTRLYQIYTSMKDRCYRENARDYHRYGARGIKVCSEWLDSSDDLTLDRIQNDLGYSPDNCRWVTKKAQANNRSNTLIITFEGVTCTASEWAKLLGVSVAAVHGHYKRTGTPYSKSALQSLRKL